MTLVAIILATLAAGIGSVWLAALLMRLGLGGRSDSVGPQHLLSLAAGALLGWPTRLAPLGGTVMMASWLLLAADALRR